MSNLEEKTEYTALNIIAAMLAGEKLIGGHYSIKRL